MGIVKFYTDDAADWLATVRDTKKFVKGNFPHGALMAMAKTEQNLKASEEFIRRVLEKNFRQKIDPEQLRAAAEKLCAALPERTKQAA